MSFIESNVNAILGVVVLLVFFWAMTHFYQVIILPIIGTPAPIVVISPIPTEPATNSPTDQPTEPATDQPTDPATNSPTELHT